VNSSRIWEESGLTLVILPSAEQGERLLKVAREWTSLRLLAPSIWVRPSGQDGLAKRPPVVEAVALASNRAGEVREVKIELFSQLARLQLGKVRLLVVRPSSPDLDFDRLQDEFVELISKYLDISIPKIQVQNDAGDDGVSLEKINLLTAPTEYVSDDPNPMLDEIFNVHFVGSAEDRSGPRTGDAFVQHDPASDKFAGFTMLHIATLGALWQGLPKGGYDLISKATWEGDSIYVSRVFVSAILTDGLVRRACARVIEAAADTQRGIEDLGVGLNIEGTFPIPDTDIDAWLDYMVDLTFNFDNAVLQYKPVLENPTPEQVKFGFFKQLGDFGSFAIGKILRIPLYAGYWIARKFATLFNDLFQGGDKGAAQVVAPEEHADSKDLLLLRKYDQVFEVKQGADEALVSPVGRGNLRSTPALWGNLRKLIFGFVDGSNLHEFGVTRSENGWPVFYKISSVFNDPSERVTFNNPADPENQRALGWGSASEAKDLIHEISESKKATLQSLSEDLSSVVRAKRIESELRVEIEALRRDLGLSSSPLPDKSGMSWDQEGVEPSISDSSKEFADEVLVNGVERRDSNV
jgi:septum formation topological specificity factor MinE